MKMTALYHLNENIAHLLEGFLESAVPLIAGLAEAIGLFIIVTSLARATYHYVRTTFFHDRYDFHHCYYCHSAIYRLLPPALPATEYYWHNLPAYF